MTESQVNTTPRPHVVLRFFAAGSVILLVVFGGIPFAGAAAFLGLLLGVRLVGDRLLTQTMLATVLSDVVAFAVFVIGAFLLRLFLNLATRPARSPLKWLAVSWAIAAPLVIWTSSVAVADVGSAVGGVLWLAFAFALAGAWLVVATGRALWAAVRRSTVVATAVTTTALLLVVIPGGVLAALPPFLERVQQLKASQPPVHELFAHPPTPPVRPATETRAAPSLQVEETTEEQTLQVDPQGRVVMSSMNSGESVARTCFAQLAGDACDDVWNRTREELGIRESGTDDALHDAYFYVCVQRTYLPPKLCGAFRLKARGLKTDAWRHTRRFRDQPSTTEPACAVPSAEDQAITQEELNVLDDACAHLDKRSQRILALAYRENLTDAVIGTRLELSTVRVRVLRRNAEDRLKRFLERCR